MVFSINYTHKTKLCNFILFSVGQKISISTNSKLLKMSECFSFSSKFQILIFIVICCCCCFCCCKTMKNRPGSIWIRFIFFLPLIFFCFIFSKVNFVIFIFGHGEWHFCLLVIETRYSRFVPIFLFLFLFDIQFIGLFIDNRIIITGKPLLLLLLSLIWTKFFFFFIGANFVICLYHLPILNQTQCGWIGQIFSDFCYCFFFVI